MRILLTGFEPFGDVKINPSQCIVEYFQSQGLDDVITLMLPVEYASSGIAITDAIKLYDPDAVLSLGVAASRNSINLERLAANIDDASIPDNVGHKASGERIVEDAPAAYWSTLPLAQMKAALDARGIAVTYSNHAGAYMCNHVFYSARHALEVARLTIPCGFIHIPDSPKESKSNLPKSEGENAPSESYGMPLVTMIEAVEICLNVLREKVPLIAC